jgi:hypothetical protein
LVTLRNEALLLADFVQKVFGDSLDPDFEGHYLNEVMEAQVGLSLRGMSPSLLPPSSLPPSFSSFIALSS